jgi:enoyl-CoA hydratase
MTTGRLLSFEEGQALGIVNEVYEGDDAAFMSRVLDFARGFVPPNKASKAVGAIKRAVQTGAEIPFETALALERELQQQLFASGDAKEGIAAYVEKRKAEFKGK